MFEGLYRTLNTIANDVGGLDKELLKLLTSRLRTNGIRKLETYARLRKLRSKT